MIAAFDWTPGNLAGRLKVSGQTINSIEMEEYDPAFCISHSATPVY
jgi:DNA-binding XRE family transcriptional regulator